MAQVPKSQLATIQISVINQSTVVTDDQVIPVVGALQKQVTNDFRPVWGIDAELQFVPSGAQPPFQQPPRRYNGRVQGVQGLGRCGESAVAQIER